MKKTVPIYFSVIFILATFFSYRSAFSQYDFSLSLPIAPGVAEVDIPFTASCKISSSSSGGSKTTLNFYLSSDKVFDNNDLFLKSVSSGTIYNGYSQYPQASLTIPSGTTYGTYYLLFVADADSLVEESNETNNVLVKTLHIGEITAMPASGSSTITKCSGYVYDNGSNVSNYNSSSSIITIKPENATDKIRLDFTVESFTLEGYDKLTIYDGLSTSATLIATYYEKTNPGIVFATGSSGAITLELIPDQFTQYSGFGAKISCVNTVPTVDLHILSSTAPDTISTSTSFAISYTCQNQGWTNASSSQVNFYLSADSAFQTSDAELGFVGGSDLSKGKSASYNTTRTLDPATYTGEYYILFYIDRHNSVTESNENNNVYGKKVYVKGVDITTNVHSASDNTIEVYPNPAKDYLEIKIISGNQSHSGTASLLNQMGQLVRSEKSDSGIFKFNLVGLSKGVYILSVDIDGKKEMRRVVVD